MIDGADAINGAPNAANALPVPMFVSDAAKKEEPRRSSKTLDDDSREARSLVASPIVSS